MLTKNSAHHQQSSPKISSCMLLASGIQLTPPGDHPPWTVLFAPAAVIAPIPPTMKYENNLFFPSLLPETYFPKSGTCPPLVSEPLKGLLYEVQVVAVSPLAGRTAVVLRARVAEVDLVAARRHAREAVVRDAIVCRVGGEGVGGDVEGGLRSLWCEVVDDAFAESFGIGGVCLRCQFGELKLKSRDWLRLQSGSRSLPPPPLTREPWSYLPTTTAQQDLDSSIKTF